MKAGTRVVVETPVCTELGFLRPTTEGEVVWDIGNRMYCCKFVDAPVQTKTGLLIETTITVIVHEHQIKEKLKRGLHDHIQSTDGG